MHQATKWPANKTERYQLMQKQMVSLIEDCPPISALANAAALLWDAMPDINWAGFYLAKNENLYLGPFQGKTACTYIPFGRGVCGTAAAKRRLQLVQDVHSFPGHIACDSASNSEIVIPLIRHDILLGVLDIDSPHLGRFDAQDADGLTVLCGILCEQIDWENGLL